jgi:hypothetical protein
MLASLGPHAGDCATHSSYGLQERGRIGVPKRWSVTNWGMSAPGDLLMNVGCSPAYSGRNEPAISIQQIYARFARGFTQDSRFIE